MSGFRTMHERIARPERSDSLYTASERAWFTMASVTVQFPAGIDLRPEPSQWLKRPRAWR
jgi:hypothetical protein